MANKSLENVANYVNSERQYHLEIPFTKKLREDYILGVFVTIKSNQTINQSTKQLTPWTVALLEKLIVTQLIKNFQSCCPSFRSLLWSCLLSKSLKIKLQTSIILPVVLYGCETCPSYYGKN